MCVNTENARKVVLHTSCAITIAYTTWSLWRFVQILKVICLKVYIDTCSRLIDLRRSNLKRLFELSSIDKYIYHVPRAFNRLFLYCLVALLPIPRTICSQTLCLALASDERSVSSSYQDKRHKFIYIYIWWTCADLVRYQLNFALQQSMSFLMAYRIWVLPIDFQVESDFVFFFCWSERKIRGRRPSSSQPQQPVCVCFFFNFSLDSCLAWTLDGFEAIHCMLISILKNMIVEYTKFLDKL